MIYGVEADVQFLKSRYDALVYRDPLGTTSPFTKRGGCFAINALHMGDSKLIASVDTQTQRSRTVDQRLADAIIAALPAIL